MQLSTYERLILLNILPPEGDIITLRIIRKLKDELSFSEEEHKALQFQHKEDGLVEWKTDADKPKEISIGEKANDIIVESLKHLNGLKKLTEEHIPIYEKFIEGKE